MRLALAEGEFAAGQREAVGRAGAVGVEDPGREARQALLLRVKPMPAAYSATSSAQTKVRLLKRLVTNPASGSVRSLRS